MVVAIGMPYRDESDNTVERCRQVVAAKPRQAEARHALAVALKDAYDPAEAVEQSCRALTLKANHGADPDNADKALPWEACGRAVSVTISKLALLSIL